MVKEEAEQPTLMLFGPQTRDNISSAVYAAHSGVECTFMLTSLQAISVTFTLRGVYVFSVEISFSIYFHNKQLKSHSMIVLKE